MAFVFFPPTKPGHPGLVPNQEGAYQARLPKFFQMLQLFNMRNSASVGVRELRQNLSVYIRRAQAGEALEVTERGRPVAMLGPLPGQGTELDRLASRGLVIRATRSSSSLEIPKPAEPSLPLSLTEALNLMRADER